MTNRKRIVCTALVGVALLSACTSLPNLPGVCALESQHVSAQGGISAVTGCKTASVATELQTAGGVQQRGTQTRTVGVPRGFLVAMIVLLLIFGLA